MPLPFDRGGHNNNSNHNYRTNSVNGQYLELVGDGIWETRYDDNFDFYGNGHFNDGDNSGTHGNTNDSRYMDLSKGYGRHQRTYNHTSQARFDPTRNSHSHIDYGFRTHH